MEADFHVDDVLAGRACAEAFQITIRGHPVKGLAHPLYWFEETTP